jgi:hypothetical protein
MLPKGAPAQRVSEWTRRLKTAPGQRIPVRELYLGNHWSIVKSLEAEATKVGGKLTLWVASAGYGMLSMDALIHPYAATFSHGRDSVGNAEAGRVWWQALTRWRLPGVRHRSFSELVESSPRRPVLVAASAAYVSAMRDDLEGAARLSTPDRFGIIAAGVRQLGELEPYLIPADSRFQHTLKGPTHSLNVAILRHAIRQSGQWYPDLGELRTRFARKLKSLAPMPTYDRSPQSDEQIKDFIRRETALTPGVKQSVLLRRLRSEGLACEQSRFKKLYLSLSPQPGR